MTGYVTCDTCNGSGRTFGISSGGCEDCGGYGQWFDDSRECPLCSETLEDGVCQVGCNPADTLLTECLPDPLRRVA